MVWCKFHCYKLCLRKRCLQTALRQAKAKHRFVIRYLRRTVFSFQLTWSSSSRWRAGVWCRWAGRPPTRRWRRSGRSVWCCRTSPPPPSWPTCHNGGRHSLQTETLTLSSNKLLIVKPSPEVFLDDKSCYGIMNCYFCTEAERIMCEYSIVGYATIV